MKNALGLMQCRFLLRIASLASVASAFVLAHATAVSAVITWGNNGHAYEAVFTDKLTWSQASSAASSMVFGGSSGYLATFTTRAEQEFVISQLGGGIVLERLWLGGYQDTSAPDYAENYGGWRWITGEPWLGVAPNDPVIPRADFGFNNLFYDLSSEEFAITWWNTGGINDFSNLGFADSRGFIVEFNPSSSVPDTIGRLELCIPVALMVLLRSKRVSVTPSAALRS